MRKNTSETKETGSRAIANNSNPIQSKRNPDLPEELQANLETSFGEDFSNVKIHENSAQANELNALAFTQGNDVHFGKGQFNPNSTSGQQLVGHEFAHVHQQRQGKVAPTNQFKGMPVNDDQSLEAEADQQGKEAVQAKLPGNQKRFGQPAESVNQAGGVRQFVIPAIVAAMGAAEWIAVGALGYSVASDAVATSSGDVGYSFDEVEGVLLPGGGNDVSAHKTAHPNAIIYEARHHLAIWHGLEDSRKMGIKFGINFLYDDAGAIGNISLSIIDVYDWPGWGGNVNVNITPRSLASGNASFRFTINVGEDNSWFVSDHPGSVQLILRGGDGDLSLVVDNFYGYTEIS
ncbi:MAG TPA: DUF4157 domain-containing protein [Sunxiuqinia sp.]|nr:DUF4157 domain-containing protein [Sunxiuqinia sp.]